MEIVLKEAKSILTPQRAGFLATGPYPFTQGLGLVGCGFGKRPVSLLLCASFYPAGHSNDLQADWGKPFRSKTNAAPTAE